MRVAVFGASGLVGTAVVERLIANRQHDVCAMIRSDASAWRLLRRTDVTLKQVDILDPKGVAAALEGCTHVINCTRGTDETMIEGLEQLLNACLRQGVARFVHLSSVAVYGDPPSPASYRESAPANPFPKSYGAMKLKQDELVRKAVRKGLPSVLLCPPNITGPCSYFLLQILDALSSNCFALVQDPLPCVTVDAANLAHAVELALTNGTGNGRRYFITDDYDLTWPELIDSLAPLVNISKMPTITASELRHRAEELRPEKASILRSAKHLVSSDVRTALRMDPMLYEVDVFLRSAIGMLPPAALESLRMAVAGPVHVPKVSNSGSFNIRLSAQQLRGVRHSCAEAKENLGYYPVVDFERSMAAFSNWYNYGHGRFTPWWPLLSQLRKVSHPTAADTRP
jgi:nucleoside-diphosphate-sugar epimerase